MTQETLPVGVAAPTVGDSSLKTIKLNAQQEEGVEVAKWCKEKPRRIGVLAGPAGSGKSSTARFIVDELGDTAIVAPTNRAARRVSKLSGMEASTIHRYLYKVTTDKHGRPTFRKKTPDELYIPKSKVLMVDESSMVSRKMFSDLWDVCRDFDMSIYLVGDSFQLPPVLTGDEAGDDFCAFDNSSLLEYSKEVRNVELTEVHRQALESPILRWATHIRLHPLDWRETVEALSSKDFPQVKNVAARCGALFEEKQDYAAISYTNAERMNVNEAVRAYLGYAPDQDPVIGERILLKKNIHSLGMFNGDIVPFSGVFPHEYQRLGNDYFLTTLGGGQVLMSRKNILGGIEIPYEETKRLPLPFAEANFGYCVTTHAAQGDQYETVIFNWEDMMVKMLKVDMRIRLIYTALTRSTKNFLVGGL